MTEEINILAAWANVNPIFIVLAIVWTMVWKGMALWRSAELRQKGWFIALLVVNTLGILEIIYLYVIARKYKVEIVEENR